MRGNVAGLASTQTTGIGLACIRRTTSSGLLHGGHGVLEGTARSEMLSGTNTTLNLLVLELILHAALLAALLLSLLGLSLPVGAGTENDVLTDGGGIERRTGGVALLVAELGPRSALSDLGVDILTNNGGLDAAGDLDLLVIVVEAV